MLFRSTHRWTIDYPEDYRFIAAVYDALWSRSRPLFSLADVLALIEARPDIASVNARHAGRSWYRDRRGAQSVRSGGHVHV